MEDSMPFKLKRRMQKLNYAKQNLTNMTLAYNAEISACEEG